MPDPLLILMLEVGRLQGQIAACQGDLRRKTAEVEALRTRTQDILKQAAALTLASPGAN